MKIKSLLLIFGVCLLPCIGLCAQSDVTVVTPLTEAGEDLDLYGVLELFQEAEDLEAFEKALNDPNSEVNNLDLDENGEVDYIRVEEYVEGDTHVLVLQVPLGENEYQDVATIEIEKKGETEYTLQAVGNEEIYGENYMIEPNPEPAGGSTAIVIVTLPIVRLVFRPGYQPYRSPWRWHRYPGWWKPWKPVPRSIHRTRVIRFHRHLWRPAKVRHSIHSHNIYMTKKKVSPKATKIKKKPPKKKPTKKKKRESIQNASII